MGTVFERRGYGHQFNQHYLNNMFTLDKNGRVAESNDFMDGEVEVCLDDERQDTRDAVADGIYSVAGIGRKVNTVEVRDVNSPIAAPLTNGQWERVLKNVKVKDMSRLWKYRNGGSPPEFSGTPHVEQ